MGCYCRQTWFFLSSASWLANLGQADSADDDNPFPFHTETILVEPANAGRNLVEWCHVLARGCPGISRQLPHLGFLTLPTGRQPASIWAKSQAELTEFRGLADHELYRSDRPDSLSR